MVVAAVAYTLFWANIVHHVTDAWTYPGDIWLTVRTSQWIDWGALSYVYSSHSGLVTLPGFPLLLSPVIAICSRLGLSEASPGIFIPKPTAYLVILPYCVLVSSTALFALDRLARCLDVRTWARRVLTIAQAAGLFSAVVMWGHPEDALAAAFLIWALVAAFEGRLVGAAWLLGAALAMQLYSILLVPLLLAMIGRRAAAPFLARAALLPGVLLIAVLIPNFHGSVNALFDQPNFPALDHATPWVLLAPKLGGGAVAAGPGRIVSLVLAVGVGVMARRRRGDLGAIAWLAAVALAGRCVFESVVDPYYILPAVAIAIAVAAARRPARFATSLLAAAALTDITWWHSDKWIYWSEMTGLFVVMLLAGHPTRCATAALPDSAMPDRLVPDLAVPLGPNLAGPNLAGPNLAGPELTTADLTASPLVADRPTFVPEPVGHT